MNPSSSLSEEPRLISSSVSSLTEFSQGSFMGIIAWIVLGLIAGFIASKIYVGSGQGLLLDIVLGIVGAVVGGYLFSALGATGVTGFNIWSMIVAIIGAVIVLWLYHMITARR